MELKDSQEIERQRELKLQREEHEYLKRKNKEFKQDSNISILRLKRKYEELKRQKQKLNSNLKKKDEIQKKSISARVVQQDYASSARRFKEIFETQTIRDIITKVVPVQLE